MPILNDSDTPFVAIGADVSGFAGTPESFFDGRMDELYIWNRLLKTDAMEVERRRTSGPISSYRQSVNHRTPA